MLPEDCADLFGYFRDEIIKRISLSVDSVSSLPEDILNKIVVLPPVEKNYGDIYTNAALVLGKFQKKAPMELAKSLTSIFNEIPGIDEINTVAPGFINFRCSLQVWHNVIRTVNKFARDYGRVDIGRGEKINVEFVSANPTGPLHVGHARGAIFGDVLANLLKWAGYDVTKEYYINDAGNQIKSLVESVYVRYEEIANCKSITHAIPYPGEYLKPIAQALFDKYGHDLASHAEREKLIRDFTLDYILNLIRKDLELLGVEHDIFTSELELQQRKTIEKCVEYLEKKGVVYEGTLERPKGIEDDVEWTQRVQKLFRSTDFGDDSDRALQKDDGTWTYFAGDIAYHFDKISRGFSNMVLVVSFDHKGYVSRINAAVEALSDGQASITVKLHNMVNFLDNGQPVKMSKRKGEFLTIKDVIEDVGRDVTRFIMLTRRNDVVLDFDFAAAREQSKDSQIFYIQYAHARICSLIRTISDVLPIEKVDFSAISSEPELALIKLLAKWPAIVQSSVRTFEPHKIAFALVDIAETFHTLWGHGSKDPSMRFLTPDANTSSARVYLAEATKHVIAAGLSIFSIVPMEEMR